MRPGLRRALERAGGWSRSRFPGSRPRTALVWGLGGMLVVALFSPAPAVRHSPSPASFAGDTLPGERGHPIPTEPEPAAAATPPPAPSLPPATSSPLPAPPALASATALRPHEIFGFAPYWELPAAGGFDVKDLTTIAYFSVDVSAQGTIEEQGGGWAGYESQALVDLVDRAHRAGTRVVLTATCFDQATLDRLVSDPGAATTLAAQLAAAVQAKNLDGVNLDFEGQGSGDREDYAALVGTVAARLHAVDPHWQVTVDTYASSAAGGGFFDVPALARAADGIFIMAYDMTEPGRASAVSPVDGPAWSVRKALASYVAAVDPSRLILGLPFYGYDWPVSSIGPDALATGPPVAVSYAQAVALPGQRYWDPVAQTEYVAYRDGSGRWHEAYYDDPVSLSIKARLADGYRLRGLGIWALGMDGNDPQMMAALLGQAAPVKLPPSQPRPGPSPSPSPSTSPSPSPSPSTSPSPSPSPSASPSPSPSPSTSPSPSPSPSASPSPSPSPSASPSPSPSPSASPSPSPSPSASPSPSPSPSASPSPSPSPSASPSPLPSPSSGG